MKLSEAVLLGSTLVKLDPGMYLYNGCGCLLGMAAAAMGRIEAESKDIYAFFPWLEGNAGVLNKIEGDFAYKIYNEKATIEQAVDYIRSVEPQDEVVEVNVIKELSEVSL